jgi:hypothetical protein
MRRIGLLALALALCGFASAKSARLYWCERSLPAFLAELDRAEEALGGGTRKLASEMSWQAWAEKRLVEAQRFMDVSEHDSSLRPASRELSRVATQIVEFHGYAQQGRAQKMEAALKDIRERSLKVRGLACEGGSR